MIDVRSGETINDNIITEVVSKELLSTFPQGEEVFVNVIAEHFSSARICACILHRSSGYGNTQVAQDNINGFPCSFIGVVTLNPLKPKLV
jgi:hypothetical protein